MANSQLMDLIENPAPDTYSGWTVAVLYMWVGYCWIEMHRQLNDESPSSAWMTYTWWKRSGAELIVLSLYQTSKQARCVSPSSVTNTNIWLGESIINIAHYYQVLSIYIYIFFKFNFQGFPITLISSEALRSNIREGFDHLFFIWGGFDWMDFWPEWFLTWIPIVNLDYSLDLYCLWLHECARVSVTVCLCVCVLFIESMINCLKITI